MPLLDGGKFYIQASFVSCCPFYLKRYRGADVNGTTSFYFFIIIIFVCFFFKEIKQCGAVGSLPTVYQNVCPVV